MPVEMTPEETRNMDGVIEQHIADAVSQERERCAYIVQASCDELKEIRDGIPPDRQVLLIFVNRRIVDLQAVVRKIESGEPPNPYWKPSSEPAE